MWGYFNGIPTHFSLNIDLLLAYAMLIRHDQPLRHRKRHCSVELRLRRPVKDSAMKRMASYSLLEPHHVEGNTAALLRSACQPLFLA